MRNVYGHTLCMYDQSEDIYSFEREAKTKKNLLLITQLLYEEQGIKDFKRFTLILWL